MNTASFSDLRCCLQRGIRVVRRVTSAMKPKTDELVHWDGKVWIALLLPDLDRISPSL